MQISLSFLVILFLVLFPGLIFRRLYFYGDFSKQFYSKHNLVSLIAVSSVPGLIILIFVYLFYDNFFTSIDLDEIINRFKDLNSPKYRLKKSQDISLKDVIYNKVAPFCLFLYLTCILFGTLSGRFVRITRLDTKLKLLRFKNYWFYLFKGHHTHFKTMRHLKEKNKKILFTKADILIDSNSKPYLYSGIVVDYELMYSDSSVLSKVMLDKAERYSLKNGKNVPAAIPGSLLVVDCTTMKNINLTYIYEDTKNTSNPKLLYILELLFGITIIALIPIFIFKSDSINWSIYSKYFLLIWYKKIFAYLLTIQTLSLLNVFIHKNHSNFYKKIIVDIIWITFLGSLIIFL